MVSHVHVHEHKRAEFLVKAATLLPHCRAEHGNIFENLYQNSVSCDCVHRAASHSFICAHFSLLVVVQACGPIEDADPCAFVWMEEWEGALAGSSWNKQLLWVVEVALC